MSDISMPSGAREAAYWVSSGSREHYGLTGCIETDLRYGSRLVVLNPSFALGIWLGGAI